MKAGPPRQDAEILGRLRSFYDDCACLLDDLALEAWAELFAPDARYRVISRENYDQGLTHATIYCQGIGMIRDRVLSVRQAVVFENRYLRHMVSGVRINACEGRVIRAQANFLVIESYVDKAPEIFMVGRYFDELRDGDEGYRIGSRDCVFDNHWIQRSLVLPI